MDPRPSLSSPEEATQEATPSASDASTSSPSRSLSNSSDFPGMNTPYFLDTDRPPPAQRSLYTTPPNQPQTGSSPAPYLQDAQQPRFTTFPTHQSPTSSPPIYLKGVDQLTLTDRITYCTARLTSLETRISAQEACIRNLQLDSMAKWLTFEEDRVRIKSQQGPQFKLEVHWTGVEATRIKIRKAEDQLAQCFRERWVLTAELAALEVQERAVVLTGKGWP
ncbi:hypothetical protein E8E13_003115 [Curvularia kusanoi]|uniref:Uncharacterized protein n=1 Tax=Curvularia kusanoi TaxID=90978 RepID=A0A9P4T4T9_CURKU|nr:hypothetical protein E8E13_003115 [Curvularia kusanoi]